MELHEFLKLSGLNLLPLELFPENLSDTVKEIQHSFNEQEVGIVLRELNRRPQLLPSGMVVKKESFRQNPRIECIQALIVFNLAAQNQFFFQEKAFSLNGVEYSVSLFPELPIAFNNDSIFYTALKGENPRKMLSSMQETSPEDQQQFYEILIKIYQNFLKTLEAKNIFLIDHDYKDAQLLCQIDKNLKHVFVGVLDFELLKSQSNAPFQEFLSKNQSNEVASVIKRFAQ